MNALDQSRRTAHWTAAQRATLHKQQGVQTVYAWIIAVPLFVALISRL